MGPDPGEAPAIQLRPASAADEISVANLLASAGLVPLDSSAQFGSQYVIGERDGTAIGVAGIELYGEDALLRSVAVAPEFRLHGVGARLSTNRIEWARSQGVRALYLLTDSAADYWARFGFERISRDSAPESVTRSHEWAAACPASAIAMRLVLRATEAAALQSP